MAKVLVTESYLEDIGDAIRSVNGLETTYKPSEMAAVIDDFYIEPTGTKTITENGTSIDVKDYASADVNVSNTYTAEDEGKVVDEGELVAQGSLTITENDTYDTTLISELIANIEGGGGGGEFITVFDSESGISTGYTYIDVYNGAEGSTPSYDSNGRIICLGAANNRKFVGFGIDLTAVEYIFINAEFNNINNTIGAIVESDISTIKTNVRNSIIGVFDKTAIPNVADQDTLLVFDVSDLSGVYYVGILGYESGWQSWLSKLRIMRSGGGGSANILSGTDAPTSDMGSDGAIYLQYFDVVSLVRYIRFTATKVRSGSEMQLSEIQFVDNNDNVFTFPSGTQYSSSDPAGYWQGAYQDAGCCIDNDLDTKFYTASFNAPSTLTYDLGSEALDLSVYNRWRWYTANDTLNRDPISFSISYSKDGTNWFELDSATDYDVTTARKSLAYSNELNMGIVYAYLKVNGAWQNLIGSDIDDVDTGGGNS